jgi:hypothetical protein
MFQTTKQFKKPDSQSAQHGPAVHCDTSRPNTAAAPFWSLLGGLATTPQGEAGAHVRYVRWGDGNSII